MDKGTDRRLRKTDDRRAGALRAVTGGGGEGF